MNATFAKLKEIKEQYPELTLQNTGYEKLNPEIRAARAELMKEITDLLKNEFPEVREFNNFKDRPDGCFWIRTQAKWSDAFTGVWYIAKSDFERLTPAFGGENKN